MHCIQDECEAEEVYQWDGTCEICPDGFQPDNSKHRCVNYGADFSKSGNFKDIYNGFCSGNDPTKLQCTDMFANCMAGETDFS